MGKRAAYTPPLRLYLVTSILFFLLISMLDLTTYQEAERLSAEAEHYPKIMFVLLPVFALFLQMLFRGTFYLSNLVFALHIHCIAYMSLALMIPMEVYEQRYPVLVLLQIPFVIYLMTYFVLALKRFYAQHWPIVIGKFITLFVLYAMVMGLSFDFLLGKII